MFIISWLVCNVFSKFKWHFLMYFECFQKPETVESGAAALGPDGEVSWQDENHFPASPIFE